MQPLARGYQEQLNAALLVLTDKNGSVLAEAGDLDIADGAIGALPEIQQALAGHEAGGFWPHADGVLQVMAVPIAIGLDARRSSARSSVGFRLDNDARRAVQARDRERHRVRRRRTHQSVDAAGGRSRAARVAAEDRRRPDGLADQRRVRRARSGR